MRVSSWIGFTGSKKRRTKMMNPQTMIARHRERYAITRITSRLRKMIGRDRSSWIRNKISTLDSQASWIIACHLSWFWRILPAPYDAGENHPTPRGFETTSGRPFTETARRISSTPCTWGPEPGKTPRRFNVRCSICPAGEFPTDAPYRSFRNSTFCREVA